MNNINKLITFDKVATILYYDVPLLSLGVTDDKKYMLLIFCDTQLNHTIYAYAEINKFAAQAFISGKVNYFKTLINSKITLFNYKDDEGFNFRKISAMSFIDKYGPDIDVDLTEYLEESQTVFIELT